MSAFVSIRLPNSIQLLADGAAYDPDGRITSFEKKVRTASRVPAAIAVRGASGFALSLADELCATADRIGVDPFLASLPAFAAALSRADIEPAKRFDFAIGIFSPAHGPRHVRLHTYPTMPAYSAFTVHELGPLVACGTMFAERELWAAGILPFAGEETVWARKRGAEIFELMRRRPCDPLPGMADQSRRFFIGGHVDVASITATGVRVKRVKEWPDQVGAPINPFAGANVTAISSMSRQQRRARARWASGW